MKRKEIKKTAKAVFKKHYFQYVLVCIICAFIATGIHNSLGILTAYKQAGSTVANGIDEQNGNDLDSSENYEDSLSDYNNNLTFLGVLSKFEKNNEKDIKDEIDQKIKQQETKTDGVFGRSNGVLAGIVNSFSTGAIYVTLISGFMSIMGSSNTVISILTIIGIVLAFLWWFLFKNIIEVIKARIFLEGRTYDKVPTNRFLFLYNTGSWLKAAWTMCLKYIFSILWSLTIIGGFIKYYSYSMVPYIVAENPNMSGTQAITLSRKMMKGHKFELFVVDLSLIGWDILDMFTLGLLGVLYLNPYRTSILCEYYVKFRNLAKENNIEGIDNLKDTYLYEYADHELIKKAYSDAINVLEQPMPKYDRPTGFKGFMANVFGIVFRIDEQQENYAKAEVRQLRISHLRNIYDGVSYPARLFPAPQRAKTYKDKSDVLYYSRCYSIWSLILMFFIFSFIGWSWEVFLHLISDGRFVNRGMLHGPWLPIYGFGGILILVLLNKFRKKPAAEFILAIVLCGMVEYFTAYFMEMAHDGMKWWDYSGYFLNIHGRVCAEGLLVFGLGGMAIVYIVAPMVDNWIRKIPLKTLIIICVALLTIYLADTIYSAKSPNTGKGITNVALIEYHSNFTNKQLKF